MSTWDLRIIGAGELRELSRRLRAAGGPQLQKNFSRRIRRAAEPLHSDLRNAVRTLPIRGQGGAGRGGGPSPTTRPLRATIARAIRISIRVSSSPGAKVWINRDSLPPDLRAMPNKLDDGSWRHPVFGNRRKWATQYAQPWWGVTIRRHQARIRAEVERVLGDIQRDLS